MEATFASLRTLTLTAGYDHKPASRGGSLKRWQRLIKANHSAANSSELAGLGDGGPLSPTAAAGASCSAMFQRRSVQGPAAAGRPPSCDAVLAAKHVLTQRSLGYLAMHGHAVASTAPTSPVSTRSNAGHSMSLVKGVALHKTLADAALEQGLSVPGLLAMAPVI